MHVTFFPPFLAWSLPPWTLGGKSLNLIQLKNKGAMEEWGEEWLNWCYYTWRGEEHQKHCVKSPPFTASPTPLFVPLFLCSFWLGESLWTSLETEVAQLSSSTSASNLTKRVILKSAPRISVPVTFSTMWKKPSAGSQYEAWESPIKCAMIDKNRLTEMAMKTKVSKTQCEVFNETKDVQFVHSCQTERQGHSGNWWITSASFALLSNCKFNKTVWWNLLFRIKKNWKLPAK